MSSHKQDTPHEDGAIIHEYDGILEANHRLPRWWLWTLYATILAGVLYWFVYGAFGWGKLPLQEFELALMARMDDGDPVTEAALLALAAEPANVDSGSKAFAKQCVRCHGDKGQGNIGPNLTDGAWIAGGSPLEIYETISKGRTSKGMQAWGPSLGTGAVKQLTAFVLSIRDTNVPGKASEGKPYVPAPPAPPPQ